MVSVLKRLRRSHRHKVHRREQEQVRRAGEAMRTAPLPQTHVDPGRASHSQQRR